VPSIIQAETVLKELAELWVSLGSEQHGEASTAVLRSCAMTLVVLAEEAEDAGAIGETLAALMSEHPSRAIVVRVRSSAERELAARVFAQCWMPFGQRRQICCEHIEITGSEASLPDLPPVLLALAAPDLPMFLWCRSPRLFQLAVFSELALVAGKAVIDSASFADPGDTLARLAASVASGQLVADLSWTRTTRWRQLIARIFENRVYQSRLPRLARIRIGFSGEAVPASAFYIAAWLRKGMSQADLEFEGGAGLTPGIVNRIELTGAGPRFAISLVEGHAAEIRVDGIAHRAAFPDLTDYILMREELGIPGRDAIFESTLAEAARLASSIGLQPDSKKW
jgi:glucose-6-phosphate dehydrogenase assembly protein OpcA